MSLRRWILMGGSALAALAVASAAVAQGGIDAIDPPSRVGRLADLRGSVWVFDAEEGRWTAAERNRPLVEGDRLSVDDDGRAELRVGPNVLRLAGGAEIELRRLDEERMHFELLAGALALRVPTREQAQQIEVFTGEGRFEPLRAGHYRFDREDEVTHAAAWRGELAFTGVENVLRIDEGERFRVWLDGRRGHARTQAVPMPSDRLAAWAQAADRAASQAAAYRYVSPEMTGAEDLDRYGRWDAHPEFGFVWIPYSVPAGWAPYRDGRWAWIPPWGWTWIDAAPWGFAPSHYGRWVHWQARWVWWPGPRHARPVFAPALVAQVSGSNVGVSVTIDLGSRYAPPTAWVPLAPYQPYVPIYRAPPKRHVHPPPRPGPRPPPGPAPRPRPPKPVPTGPIRYGPDGLPGGVTSVPADALAPRAPTATPAPGAPQRRASPDGRRAPLPVARPRDPSAVAPRGVPADAAPPAARANPRNEPPSGGLANGRRFRAPSEAERAPEERAAPAVQRPAPAAPPWREGAPAMPPPPPREAAPAMPSPREAAPPAAAPPPEAAPRREGRAEPRRREQVN